MSKNRDRIIKTLEKYGLKAEEIDWKPLGISFEMQGREGGWLVEVSNGNTYLAENIDFLINEIETYEGNHTDLESIQKYCNHIPWYVDGRDHSKGLICANRKCGKFLGYE